MPEKNPPAPFSNSYWVLPRLLLAGGYPGGMAAKNTERKLDALLEAGLRTFINLIDEDETLLSEAAVPSYHALLRQLARRHGAEVTYLRIPIADRTVPSFSVMRQILDTIDRSLREGDPVFVHCWAGLGRTGTVVGCFLKRHGISNAIEVIPKIRELRQHTDFAGESSPHTGHQVKLVVNWRLHS